MAAGHRTNLLAAAGKLREIRLLHPEQLVCYAEMRGHKDDVACMIFHPEKPTILFSGDSKVISQNTFIYSCISDIWTCILMFSTAVNQSFATCASHVYRPTIPIKVHAFLNIDGWSLVVESRTLVSLYLGLVS